MDVAHLAGRRIRIRGTVQGVGFRPWVYRTALAAGVTGHVRNDAEGVTIDAFGDDRALKAFVDDLRVPPPAARIASVELSDLEPLDVGRFEIRDSAPGGERTVSIPPDLATCPDCVAEIFDRSNRRYRYPFTNCTNCGPRFTIATDIPYDRAATTMAPFAMCEACRREYEDPANRRFHAQPNACPDCGPRLSLLAPDGAVLHVDDPIARAARALRDGLVVAVKGIGGFHLACDARSDAAVRRLRARKKRDEKPLAVMIRDLRAADALAALGPDERALLSGVERPIVLVRKRVRAAIAPSVAPRNQMVGLFLPYSPLHHLLLADAGRPLVMTSGNLSDEPIAYRTDEAIARLADIADLFLVHDREIETRCDDSVVAVVAGRGAVLRRSRGYVPRAIALRSPVTRPVLGCGALLKNTFCLASGARAWLGPHIGDLENLATFDSYTASIQRMERFLEIEPAIVAHDMHPDYLSTRYAEGRTSATKVAVQHHHAHVASAMAEHGLGGPVIGLAYDGTGFGTDGTIWGGEILIATAASFERAATFRPIALAGGDVAIREPWRIALALAIDAFDGDLPDAVHVMCAGVPEPAFDNVVRLLRSPDALPRARGVGRYFDGFAALFLGRVHAAFEGQLALEWNQAADPSVKRRYRFGLSAGEPSEIDLRETVRDALVDLARGASIPSIAAAFHNTLAAATDAAVRAAGRRYGRLPVVASGGCFQNARLAESVRAALAPDFDVRFHEQVPPGDGGIALGQVVVASAMEREASAERK
jgi:hydrogenase maturation protein HypF